MIRAWGRTPPVESLTVPRIVPVSTCAVKAPAETWRKTAARARKYQGLDRFDMLFLLKI